MFHRIKLVPWLITLYMLVIGLTPGENASAIKIRPDSCTDAMGDHGTCMFVWECIKQEGKQLGPCVDRFLVGTCCALPSEEDNMVPGAEPGGINHGPFSPSKNESNEVFSDSSNVRPTTMTFSTMGLTTAVVVSEMPANSTIASTSTASQKSSSISTTSKPSPHPALDPSNCGLPTPSPKMKVVGGTQASFGDWPWQVSIRRTSFFGFASTHRCGGAILNANWVVTAAHCVDDLMVSQIRIRVGEFDFSSTQEPYPFQERGITKKVVHPKYNFFTYENDLALLKLDASLQLQTHVKPICLPPANETFVGKNASVTGWGRLSEGGELPSKLQQVQVPVVSNEKCKEMFLKAGRQEQIPEIFLCAGFETGGRDSCQGDSGGPLQIKGDDGRWVLAGVISWGIGCAEANMPGVCTRVNKFTDWILKTIS